MRTQLQTLGRLRRIQFHAICQRHDYQFLFACSDKSASAVKTTIVSWYTGAAKPSWIILTADDYPRGLNAAGKRNGLLTIEHENEV